MPQKKILYISGSLGLGHITRDLAIANELRRQNSDVEISWLASHPASQLIDEAGEKLHPKAGLYANDNIPAENAAKSGQLNLLSYLNNARNDWSQNFEVFAQITHENEFDLVVGDETYEISVGLNKKPDLKRAPYIMIFDFIGLDAMTNNPLEKLGIYIWNRVWSSTKGVADLSIFVGEEADVPDRKFGLMLPNRLKWAKELCEFVGYALPFDPKDYEDKAKVREKLGYGSEPLIICAVGGTTVGKGLLELCGQAYPIVKEKIPDVHMVLVCGPRLKRELLQVPDTIEIRGYVPALYEHYAASDLAIVQSGGTSTLELTALNRPFLYFPLEQHCEQQLNVVPRIQRHGAGVKMSYRQTTPEQLAEKIVETCGKEVSYAPIPVQGAQNAARLINQFL